MLHHVSGEHTWATGRCHHSELTEADINDTAKTPLGVDSQAMKFLRKIVLDAKWMRSMAYYTRSRYWFSLEIHSSPMVMMHV